MSDIDIGLGIDTSEAERDLSRFRSLITGAVAGISAGFAAVKIGQFLADGIAGAIEAEAALAKLSNQLKISGDFSEEVVRQFDEFAGSLERATNVSAEAILEQLSLAKAFGLTDEQSKNLVKAATELSAVTGKDLTSSVDTLIKSYNGQTRELDKTIAGVKEFTKEQLANGAAIDLISARYAGTAAKALDTYQGAIASVGRAFEDSGKEVGKAVIGNTQLIAVIRQVTKSLDGITDYISNNSGKINSFVTVLIDGFFGAAKGVTYLASIIERVLGGAVVAVTVPLEGMIGVFKSLAKLGGKATESISEGFEDAEVYLKNFNNAAIEGVAKNEGAFASLNKEIGEIQKGLKTTAKVAGQASNDINKAAKNTRSLVDGEELKKAQTEYKQFVLEITKAVATETQKVNLSRDEQLEKLRAMYRQGVISAQDAYDTEVLIAARAAKEIGEIQKKEREKSINDAKTNPIKILFEYTTGGAVGNDVLAAAGVSIATGFISAVKKGEAGASEAGAKIAEGFGNFLEAYIGDDFLFGLGGFFKAAFEFVNQSSEEIEAQFKGFFEGIPQIVENLGESAPAIARAFIETILGSDFVPRLVESLIQSMVASGGFKMLGDQWGIRSADQFMEKTGSFFSDLFNGFENTFLGKFFSAIGTLFTRIYTGISQALDMVFGKFVQRVGELFQQIWTNFGLLFNNFTVGITNLWGYIVDAIGAIGPNLRLFFDDFFSGIATVFEKIGLVIRDAFNWVIEGLKGVFDGIIDAVNKLVDGVKSIGGGVSDGAKSFGGKVSDSFKSITGMAEGGVVPPGYPNDSYPAFLTSGETVSPPGELPSNDLMVALLGQILAKLSQPMSVTTTAEVNGRALAEIILQLSRNNARLA